MMIVELYMTIKGNMFTCSKLFFPGLLRQRDQHIIKEEDGSLGPTAVAKLITTTTTAAFHRSIMEPDNEPHSLDRQYG